MLVDSGPSNRCLGLLWKEDGNLTDSIVGMGWLLVMLFSWWLWLMAVVVVLRPVLLGLLQWLRFMAIVFVEFAR